MQKHIDSKILRQESQVHEARDFNTNDDRNLPLQIIGSKPTEPVENNQAWTLLNKIDERFHLSTKNVNESPN